jgi:hypothetical protein
VSDYTPMTAEQWKQAIGNIVGEFADTATEANALHEALGVMLADVNYWRMAVKNASAEAEGMRGDYCVFCSDDGAPCEHKVDCPWILANQE